MVNRPDSGEGWRKLNEKSAANLLTEFNIATATATIYRVFESFKGNAAKKMQPASACPMA